MKRIGVVGVPGGWSSERLADALARKTGYRSLIDVEHLCFDLAGGRVWTAGSELTLPDAIIIKKIGAEYSPRHRDRIRLLQYLYDRGLPMFSRPERILRAYDRLSCTLQLRTGGIPMPPTIITEDLKEAVNAVRTFEQAVIKPLYTSKARGMRVLRKGDILVDELRAFQTSGNPVLYIQKLIALPGRDLGVTFLGGRYVATYARVRDKDSWSTSTLAGGHYEPCEPSPDVVRVAERAQGLFGLDFTCVDVAETAEGPVVFEVSPFGGFRGLLQAHQIDAADLYAEYVLTRLGDA